MKRFHWDKNDYNEDFMQMETANESGNGEASSRIEAFVAFGKGFDGLTYVERLRDLAIKKI